MPSVLGAGKKSGRTNLTPLWPVQRGFFVCGGLACTGVVFGVRVLSVEISEKRGLTMAAKTKELKKEIKHRKAKINGQLAKLAKALKKLKKKS
jgi:hypothetical protein